MTDALSYRDGALDAKLHILKQWPAAPFERRELHGPSVLGSQYSDCSNSPSGSSDGSSQGSNDSDTTAATSLSPESYDQLSAPYVANIFIDDKRYRHIQNSAPTSTLPLPRLEDVANFPSKHDVTLKSEIENAPPAIPDQRLMLELNSMLHENLDATKELYTQWPALGSVKTHSDVRFCSAPTNKPEEKASGFSHEELRHSAQQTDLDIKAISNGQRVYQGDLVDRSKQHAHINDETKVHPRRTKPQVPRPLPTLQRQEQRRNTYVDALVGRQTTVSRRWTLADVIDITMRIIAKIWPTSCRPVQLATDLGGEQQLKSNPVICLRYFIEEVLKRSRTSHSTLQVALFYCYKLGRSGRVLVGESARLANCDPSTRLLQCGRRMFLCSLILASKFIQDRNYSTRAWSKISSLPITEINQCEMAMLRALDYKIFIKAESFTQWARQTTICVEQTRMGLPCPFTFLDSVIDSDLSQEKVGTLPLMGQPGLARTPSPESFYKASSDSIELPVRTMQPPTVGAGDGFYSAIPPMPAAPQLSNASSPSSSPDSESGHPSTRAGSIIHWHTSHPTASATHVHGVQNNIKNGLLTPTPTSPGSTTDGESTVSSTTDGLDFSPRSRAADAQAWSELEQMKQETSSSSSAEVEMSTSTSPKAQDMYLQEQESYLEKNSWIEETEDDLMRQLEKKSGSRKFRQPAAVSMQRKRSIGRCLGSHPRHHSGRGDKKPCNR